MSDEPAHRASWKTLPFPEAKAKLIWNRSFSAEEARLLRLGLIPRSMDDRWFAFVEDDWLYLHRSWTGDGIFAVQLEDRGDATQAVQAWVTMEASYRPRSWEERIDTLNNVIDMMLSEKPFASQGFTITKLNGTRTEFYKDGRR